MSDHRNLFVEYKPTLRERFWRWPGYRGRSFPMIFPPEDWKGYMRTDCVIHLSWADALRLLVSRRALVRIQTHTEFDCGGAMSNSAVEIVMPGKEVAP